MSFPAPAPGCLSSGWCGLGVAKPSQGETRITRLDFRSNLWDTVAMNKKGERALTENIRVRLSKEQLRQLQEIAERDDRSVGAVARRAINDLLARNGKESP